MSSEPGPTHGLPEDPLGLNYDVKNPGFTDAGAEVSLMNSYSNVKIAPQDNAAEITPRCPFKAPFNAPWHAYFSP